MSKRRSVLFTALLVFLVQCSAFSAETQDPRDSASPFGVLDFIVWDHNWNGFHYGGDKPERAVALMQEAGVGWVRLDFLWDDIEPEKEQWDFAKVDRLVELFQRHGIRILGLLNYNAGWTGGDWKDAPDPALFERYARQVVRRYKDKVKYWEVWNEPNLENYWVPQDGMKSYTVLLRRTSAALREEDPSCRVVLGGLSVPLEPALEQIYAQGGKESFDIVAIHPFVNPLDKNARAKLKGFYEEVLGVMERYGDADKPIWLTELGCPGVGSSKQPNNWWLGTNPNEVSQARWVDVIYDEPLRWKGVEKVFWAFFRDTPDHFLSGTDFFGLVREDFSKKPAFEAYKRKATGSEL